MKGNPKNKRWRVARYERRRQRKGRVLADGCSPARYRWGVFIWSSFAAGWCQVSGDYSSVKEARAAAADGCGKEYWEDGR